MINFTFNKQQFTIDPNAYYNCSIGTKAKKFTPLMYLVMNSRILNCDEELNEYIMLHNSSELNKKNDIGLTALMLACRNSFVYSSKNVVLMLINAGANLDLQDDLGRTALMHACSYNAENIVKLLVDAGANVNLKDCFNENALIILHKCNCEFHITDSFKMILDAGINLNFKYKNRTGFEYICEFMNEKLIKYCFDTHKYYTEADLIKCIMLKRYQKLISSYLVDIYFDKLSDFILKN